MAVEQDPNVTPIGLYRDPESGTEIGAIHESQAAAMVRAGHVLVPNGDPYKTTSQMLTEAQEAEAKTLVGAGTEKGK